MKLALALFALLAIASAKIYYQEDFKDGWESRWVQSTFRPENERGRVGVSAGKYYTAEEEEKGLQTQEDARFYTLSSVFPEEFSNKGKTLVLQYSLKQEQSIDCGGGYLKLHPAGLDQSSYNGDSQYNIMFGPDICGSTRRTHFIVTKEGKNHLITQDVPTESDTRTHIYTLVLKPDNTFSILTDGKETRSGNLEDDFSILEPKTIKDPSQSKPSDWVDEKFMDDPSDVKPEGYDAIEAEINDPEAEKPEDWDTELDGEWEAPRISNPEYKGPWRPKKIENPLYKGEWVHPVIDNPKFASDATLYSFDSFASVGIEIWQVKSGSIYDNILVTDSEAEAEAARAKISTRAAGEKLAEEAAAKDVPKEEEVDVEEDEEKTDL